MDLELVSGNSLDYSFDLESENFSLDPDSEISDGFNLLSTLVISIGFTCKDEKRKDKLNDCIWISVILSFDFVYPRRLTGRRSNGQEISLDVCPDDQSSIQMSFGVDEVELW